MTADVYVVFALVLLALVSSVPERFPVDVTAILAMVSSILLEPWTQNSPCRSEKIPFAVAIIAGVVALPAVNVSPIVVSAFADVVAMVLAGVLEPTDLSPSVDWTVIFLLAGVTPLGTALQQTGAAGLIGGPLASTATVLPAIGVPWVLYLSTGQSTSVISIDASVVLMIPVAAGATRTIEANAFALVLAVTFAASRRSRRPSATGRSASSAGPVDTRSPTAFASGRHSSSSCRS